MVSAIAMTIALAHCNQKNKAASGETHTHVCSTPVRLPAMDLLVLPGELLVLFLNH